ncbi:hypothetical protein GUJ93_ZPchr0001g30622 [Zizania palustris]|uniref:Uncharacterized protein n=1 Tax=Zizania palustris TaxID=103762 RepID=A0A8J5RP91_ZIZPA|nr:hypothetical protein GUJ93_ZPchr0001g30622 [Zizania palustris]
MTGGNEATEEDDDEALSMIIRRTKQNKRKHILAKAVGRPESEWSFIGEIEISLPFFDRLGIDSTIIVSDFEAVRRGGYAAYAGPEVQVVGRRACAYVAVGVLRPTPSRTAKAKAPKKRSMSDLFMVAPSLTLPPPTDPSGGNEVTDEDDDEDLCVIIRRTKHMKRKRKLDETVAVAAAAAVGRPERI